MLVAAAATAALGNHQALVGKLKIVHQLAGFRVEKRRAHRDLKDDVVPVRAGAVGAHSVLTALRLVLGVVAEMDQGVVPLGRLHDHVASAAAVAAGGPAAGNELLPPEGHAAVPAVAGLHPDLCLIDKHLV